MEVKEKRTYDFLDKLDVEYTRYEHEPLMTIAAAEELDKKIGLEICSSSAKVILGTPICFETFPVLNFLEPTITRR